MLHGPHPSLTCSWAQATGGTLRRSQDKKERSGYLLPAPFCRTTDGQCPCSSTTRSLSLCLSHCSALSKGTVTSAQYFTASCLFPFIPFIPLLKVLHELFSITPFEAAICLLLGRRLIQHQNFRSGRHIKSSMVFRFFYFYLLRSSKKHD